MLNEQAVNVLRESGWFAGRRAFIDSARRSWASIDRLPSRAVEEFIKEYFSISFAHPHHWSKDAKDITHIDPVAAVANTSLFALANEYEVKASGRLTPIGLMDCGVLLFAGLDGAIYGGNSPYFGRYGESFEDFLNLLFSSRRPVVLQ
ncbi:SUKH-3 domain-containing protein [Streptodolium elevatio]